MVHLVGFTIKINVCYLYRSRNYIQVKNLRIVQQIQSTVHPIKLIRQTWSKRDILHHCYW